MKGLEEELVQVTRPVATHHDSAGNECSGVCLGCNYSRNEECIADLCVTVEEKEAENYLAAGVEINTEHANDLVLGTGTIAGKIIMGSELPAGDVKEVMVLGVDLGVVGGDRTAITDATLECLSLVKRKREPKPKLTEEEKIVFIYTENVKLMDMVKKQAEKTGMTVVLLTEEDFKVLGEREAKAALSESLAKTMEEFVGDKDNFKHAEEHCKKLYDLITPKNVIDTINLIHTETEIVKKTTLTHSKTAEVLNLLSVFGFITFTKGHHEFKFNVDPEIAIESARKDVIASCEAFRFNKMRFDTIVSQVRPNTMEQLELASKLLTDIKRRFNIEY